MSLQLKADFDHVERRDAEARHKPCGSTRDDYLCSRALSSMSAENLAITEIASLPHL